MPTGRSPNQRDIARRAGVSQAAVSAVLNDKADLIHLAPATQERVREAMAELGYVPNVAGRSLRGGRNGLIGVHTYESVFPVVSDDYYHEFLIGIEQAAVRARQDLILFASTEAGDGTRSIYGRSGNRLHLADGSVILGHQQPNEEIAQLAREGYPFVYIGRRRIEGVEMSYVTADYAGGVRAIVDAVAAMGHQSVAYLADAGPFDPLVERRVAFETRARELGLLAQVDTLSKPAEFDVHKLDDLRAAGVTAVLAENPEIAEALAESANDARIAVPRDMSVVVLDQGRPALRWSRLEVPRRAMGVRAVQMLLELLDDPERKPRHEALACGPVDPGTIARPRTGS